MKTATLVLFSCLFLLHGTAGAASKPPERMVPADWDPALAGDRVMKGLVKVTGPMVKGAHDAEFSVVGRHAYIVAEVDDESTGESAARPNIYSTLSIVNLDSLKVEDIQVLARGGQEFGNVRLPVGAVFVPRILQIGKDTLRCYFASERPGQRQSQTWYRDFNISKRAFERTIHKAKLKTAAGVFDMQPQYLHADAMAHGFRKPAKDFGLYLFDSFKVFDGRTYIALNNFPGKQNALAVVHDDFATFEVLGHYNEPQSAQLSESAVNRLPDGSWMAICRNDGGNYHFTTSKDGREWTVGRELPHVPNGASSKPTFDRFGDLYYLGWQEATRIHGANRSVFNIDVSRDGKHWERKYRFETTKSFQYPTFHEHEGTIWLTVTQGDHSPSRKERIMFGRLEAVGEFSSQKGLVRKPIPVPQEPPAIMKPGVKLFTDRDYTLIEAPSFLMGNRFLRTSIEGYTLECVAPGELHVMTLSKPHVSNRKGDLLKMGFRKVDTPEFHLFRGDLNHVFAYSKRMESGEKLTLSKLAFPVLGDGLKIKLLAEGKPKAGASRETREEEQARIAKMEKIADHALVPPTVNTSPLPEYDYDKLDYGMTIGMERTPGGRLWACWVAGGDSPDAFFVLASSDDDGNTWSKPRVVLDSHDPKLPEKRSILVGNLWTDPKGRLWLFFDQSMDMFDGRAGVWATVCSNPDSDEPTWSTPRRIWHGVTLNKPTVLSTGEWMLPISLDQRPGFRSFRGCFKELDPLRGANVFVSRDEGETWERRGVRTFEQPDWHEHMIVEKKDGTLWMLARTRQGITESLSSDGGASWSSPRKSGIVHPVARFFIRRLQSGRLLLIKHGDRIDEHQGRVKLSAWLSDDDGASWKGGLILDDRKGVSYPDGLQAPDGTIYISWDRNRSTDGEILMARFNEEDVLGRAFKGPRSRTKMLISRPLKSDRQSGPGAGRKKEGQDKKANVDLPSQESPQISAIVRKYFPEGSKGGLAVLVIRDNAVLHNKGYGLKNGKEPVTPQTRMGLASISKQFAAMCAAMLIEEGKLGLTDKVSKHLPDLELPEKGRELRVQDLVWHISGLPNFIQSAEKDSIAEYKKKHGLQWLNNETHADWLTTMPLRRAPGEEWEYTNSGYVLLARIIEVISGKPFHEFQQERILDVLGMKDTTDSQRFNGSGNMVTTLEDYAKWDRALWDGSLLGTETSKLLFQPGVFDNGEPVAYGFGWKLKHRDGKLIEVEHGGVGSAPNHSRNLVLRYMESRITIAMFARENLKFNRDLKDDLVREILRHVRKN